jgi:hypothetical protein
MLPSWVPDWLSQSHGSGLKPHMPTKAIQFIDHSDAEVPGISLTTPFCASYYLTADVEFLPESMLCVKAVLIDQVAMEHILRKPGDYKKLDTIMDDWFFKVYMYGPDEYITGENLRHVLSACLCFQCGHEIINEDGLLEVDGPMRLSAMDSMDGTWRFFRSPKGYMGMVPATARYSDMLCVLIGASAPFVLRKEADHYIIISQAYIHGFMHGRAIDMKDQGELKVEKVSIF